MTVFSLFGRGCRGLLSAAGRLSLAWTISTYAVLGCGAQGDNEVEGPVDDPPECAEIGMIASASQLFLTFDKTEGDAFMDEGSGAHRVDVVGTVNTVEGRCGRAIAFDGSESWVEVPDDPLLDGTNGFTVEVTMMLDTWAEVSKPVQKQNPDTFIEFAYGILVANEGAFVTLDLPGCRVVGTEGVIELGRWIHVAAVWNPGEQSGDLYVNGRLDASNANPCEGPYTGAGWPLVIGGVRNRYDVWFPFPGAVDNVAFFDHPRTPEQICTDSLGTWDGATCVRPEGEGIP